MKKTLTLLFMLLATLNGYSQFSKTHYIPPLTASTFMGSTTIDVDQYIYISTPSATSVSVTITPIGGIPVTSTVANTNPWVYMISAPTIPDPTSTPSIPKPNKLAKDGNNTQLFVPSYLLGTVLKDRGYLIEATDFVYANLRVQSKIGGRTPASSQAGSLVAKGTSAYGTEFRIGGMENRAVMGSGNGEALMNFASFVATEDNTTVSITIPRAPIGTFMFPKTLNGNYPYSYPFPNTDFYFPPAGAPVPTSYTTPTSQNYIYNGPITVTLNKNESYVIAMENSSDTTFESNYMLGGLITSNRSIVVNCGSIGGNSQIQGEGLANSAPYNDKGKDFGFDQIVGADKTGKEYIFVAGSGMNAATNKAYDLERAIIVANTDGTQIFKNGGPTPVKTINAGEYYVFNGNDYVNGNLYVTTSEKVFAYQTIAGVGSSGITDAGNQNMCFVPPLNCGTPSVVNQIPLINEIGLTTSTNGLVTYPNTVVNIVTQKFMADGVTVNNVYVNGAVLTASTPGLTRTNVTGKTDIPFVAYSYKTHGGSISVTSSAQVYVSYYGSNNNATYGSYFSGFDTKPVIGVVAPTASTACVSSDIVLSVRSAVTTDLFKWQYSAALEDTPVDIPGATGNSYTPKPIPIGGKGAGYYRVVEISACSNTSSYPIAVSECPDDIDNDGVYNNIDIDNDNDGIVNATESYGDQNIDVSGTTGTLAVGTYSNSYTGTTTPVGTDNTFTGNPDGSFTTSLVAGNTNAITYRLDFTNPVNLGLKYNSIVGPLAGSISNAAFAVKTDINSTITVSNPTNQLLIDTDNDGIYESGIKEFSSFEVKFKLNPAVLLAAPNPALDFKIQTYMSNSISFTHKNSSNNLSNTASFSFYAVAVPKDLDSDGIIDQLDTDSDDDGILDIVEGPLEDKTKTLPLGKTKAISFTDVNKNGLEDNFEPIIAPVDIDGDGVADYLDLDSDNDGILDSEESAVDADSDGIKNYRDEDSDGDTYNDVVEAGFTDPDSDGVLGNSPVAVDAKGKVISGVNGYTTPNAKYLINETLGVNDSNTVTQFALYPNPTTGILNIESNIEDDFTVVNQLGQVVKTLKVNVGTNKVNLENLVDGVYFLKNKSGENQVVKKIIKN